MTVYTLRDLRHGESLTVAVCDQHAADMPACDGEHVEAQPADDDIACELCRR